MVGVCATQHLAQILATAVEVVQGRDSGHGAAGGRGRPVVIDGVCQGESPASLGCFTWSADPSPHGHRVEQVGVAADVPDADTSCCDRALNSPCRRRNDVVGIFPDRGFIVRPVGAVVAEQGDEWVDGRRYLGLRSRHQISRRPCPHHTTAA